MYGVKFFHVIIIVAILTYVLYGQNEPECGVIIGLTGKWRTSDNHRQLALGDRIPPLNLSPENMGTQTLTVWFEGKQPISYRCSSCIANIPEGAIIKCAQQEVERKSKAQSSSASFWALLMGQPSSRYFTAASRGLEGDLKEAVLLKSAQVDIAPAMADLIAGTYWVHFDSLRGDRHPTLPRKVQWEPGKAAMVASAGLKSDLYRLELVEQSGETTGSEAWVLASDPQHYPTTSAKFQEMVKTTASWPADVDPIAIRAVLRVTLESLSSPSQR